MHIRIGFPVIRENPGKPDDGKPFTVWVSTSPSGGRGQVLCNGKPLNPKQPFGSARQDLNDSVNRILHNRNIQFQCSDINPDSRSQVRFKSRSYGLIMSLAEQYDLPETATTPLHLLITGALDLETGHPRPLSDQQSIRTKGKLAGDSGCALLLLPIDYDLLDEESGRYYASWVEGAAVESPEEMQRWISSQMRGRAYLLPVDSEGRWTDDSNADWRKRLAELLGLTKYSETPAGAHPQPEEPLQGAEVKTNTLGSLFSAAIPFHDEYRAKFLEHNRDLCKLELFDNGVGMDALRQKDQLFFRDGVQPDRHVLIGGPTGCGKTFLGEALILNVILEGEKTIYIAPTRSLAAERCDSLRDFLAFEGNGVLEKEDDIILSTGEETKYDWRLHRGRFRVAVMVNEKANLFLRPTMDLMGSLGMVVIDELHMLANANRGGLIDLLIAKIHSENERRRDPSVNKMPIRMVGITTEESISSDAIEKAFSSEDAYGSIIPPVILKTKTRPVEVEHVACAYGRTTSVPEEIPIVKFSRQDDRHLPEDTCRKLVSRINFNLSEIDKNNLLTGQKGRGEVNLGSLKEIIIRYSRPGSGYKTVLVAHPSIDQLKVLAEMLKEHREKEKPRPTCVPDKKLEQKVAEGHVSVGVGKQLKSLAHYGIYLHHSELPGEIRHLVEERFRNQPSRTDGWSEILFATETLFYGVNLSTDCVILTSPLWPREVPGEVEPDSKEITANEMHNILGRVGRPGFKSNGTLAKAVVCFPSGFYSTDPGDVRQAINRYYGTGVNNRQVPESVSTLLIQTDINKLRKGTITNLKAISYPTFRSVMDALRHLGGREASPVNTREVVAFMQKTVFFQSNLCSNRDAEELIRLVLDFAVEEKLVEGSADGYKIKPEAEALIDTGTKWQSVSPMGTWLEMIQQLRRELGQQLPAELLVPAFVSSSELWNTSRTFCWEFRERALRPELRIDSEEYARRALMVELQLLGLTTASCEAVERKLSELVISLESQLALRVGQYRKAVFYRLVVAFLRWLRGVDKDEIAELSLKVRPEDKEELDKSLRKEARQFKERFTDRASWLSIMCLRYFDTVGQLLPEHRRELPRLGERLRLGVTPPGLPLLTESRIRLARSEVQRLVEKGVTPQKILCDASPGDLIQNSGVLTNQRYGNITTIVDDLFAFYQHQVTQLVDKIGIPETNPGWQAFQNLLEDIFNKKAPGQGIQTPMPGHKSKLCEALAWMFSVEEKTPVIRLTDRNSLRLGGPEDDALVLNVAGFGETAPITDLTADVVVWLPWPRDPSAAHGVQLTACGGMVLAYLVGRKFIKSPVRVIKTWAKKESGLKSIEDLLDFDMPDLPAELRESMLRFNEPGI